MSASGAITVSGKVLDVDFKSGNEGTDRAYAFHIIHVLTGRTVSEVRWDSKRITEPLPKEGDELAVEVELSAFKDRVQIGARRRVHGAVHAVKHSA